MDENTFPILTQPILINEHNPEHRSLCFTDYTMYTKRKELYLYIYNIKSKAVIKKHILDNYYHYEYSSRLSFGADCTGDGIEEYVMVTKSGSIYAYNVKGEVVEGYPTKPVVGEGVGGRGLRVRKIVMVDINNDGKKEIVLFIGQRAIMGRDETDPENYRVQVIDLKGNSYINKTLTGIISAYHFHAPASQPGYLYFLNYSNRKNLLYGIDLKTMTVLPDYPVEFGELPYIYPHIIDTALLEGRNALVILIKEQGKLLIFDYITREKKVVELSELKGATRILSAPAYGMISSGEMLYVYNDKTRSVLVLDSKYRIKNIHTIEIDKPWEITDVKVMPFAGIKTNYLVLSFEKKGTVSIDELFEKYGDKQEYKVYEDDIINKAYDRYKTYDFPDDEIQWQKRRKLDIKQSLLIQKIGGEKLSQLQTPSSSYKIIILINKKNKFTMDTPEDFTGYTSTLSRSRNVMLYELFPVCFFKTGQKEFGCIAPLIEFSSIDEHIDLRRGKLFHLNNVKIK